MTVREPIQDDRVGAMAWVGQGDALVLVGVTFKDDGGRTNLDDRVGAMACRAG